MNISIDEQFQLAAAVGDVKSSARALFEEIDAQLEQYPQTRDTLRNIYERHVENLHRDTPDEFLSSLAHAGAFMGAYKEVIGWLSNYAT